MQKYTNIELKDIISSCVTSNPRVYTRILQRDYPDVITYLHETFYALHGHSLAEYCYWLLHDLNDFPKCKNSQCFHTTKFRGITQGYLSYCSSKCAASDECVREQFKSTNLKKYGVDHPLKLQSVQDKITSTNLERYGVKCTLQDKNVQATIAEQNIKKYGVSQHLSAKPIRDKIKATNLERYGCISTLASQEVKDKIRQTNMERYGAVNPAQSSQIQDKIKATNLEKYGVEYPVQSSQIQDKIKATNLEKYGSMCVLSSPSIRMQIKQTCIDRFGVENVSKSPVIKEKIRTATLRNHNVEYGYLKASAKEHALKAKRVKSFFNNVITDIDEPLFTVDYFVDNYSPDLNLQFKCKKCGNVFTSTHVDGRHQRCQQCYPHAQTSIPEVELSEFISQYVPIIRNSRNIISPQELDIFIPSKNMAIEFDGLYWHRDNDGTKKDYHLVKSARCEELNIQLIHVFENEWIYSPNIVKSRIKNFLGIYNTTIFARKCQIAEVCSTASCQFQDCNHLQGSVKSQISLGLYFNDELVSLMTFSKPRFDKKHEWELVRFCNKLGYHIPGAASKLLKWFERKYTPKSVVSYADRRWSKGNLYMALGFQLDHVSPPNYWYFKGGKLESRIKYQKHKLKEQLKTFDETLSEVENMKNNGYYRIFDCGNLVFVKSYQ